MSNCGKCMRPGPVTSNGFLNFLREFRKKHCGLTVIQTAKQGAKEWNCMPECAKNKYRRMGECPMKRKPRKKCGSKKRSRSKCRRPKPKGCAKRRKRSCARKKPKSCQRRRRPTCGKRKKCTKQGPLTNNGYLNFLRWYRKKHCGMKAKDIIKSGARRWCKMSQEKKDRFNKMACKVTQSCRRRNTPLCRSVLQRKKGCE